MASKVYPQPGGGWLKPAIEREGRRQRQIRQALLGADRPLSTAELAEACWPRMDLSHQPRWRWLDVRRRIERYAVRTKTRRSEGRARYLMWIAKPELDGEKG